MDYTHEKPNSIDKLQILTSKLSDFLNFKNQIPYFEELNNLSSLLNKFELDFNKEMAVNLPHSIPFIIRSSELIIETANNDIINLSNSNNIQNIPNIFLEEINSINLNTSTNTTKNPFIIKLINIYTDKKLNIIEKRFLIAQKILEKTSSIIAISHNQILSTKNKESIKWIDFNQTCDYLRISRRTLSKYIKMGKITAYKPGGKFCTFKESEIIRFIELSKI